MDNLARARAVDFRREFGGGALGANAQKGVWSVFNRAFLFRVFQGDERKRVKERKKGRKRGQTAPFFVSGYAKNKQNCTKNSS